MNDANSTVNNSEAENERVWQEYLANGKTGAKSVNEGEVRKYINNVLKKTTHTWLSEVGSNVMKQSVKEAKNAEECHSINILDLSKIVYIYRSGW